MKNPSVMERLDKPKRKRSTRIIGGYISLGRRPRRIPAAKFAHKFIVYFGFWIYMHASVQVLATANARERSGHNMSVNTQQNRRVHVSIPVLNSSLLIPPLETLSTIRQPAQVQHTLNEIPATIQIISSHFLETRIYIE